MAKGSIQLSLWRCSLGTTASSQFPNVGSSSSELKTQDQNMPLKTNHVQLKKRRIDEATSPHMTKLNQAWGHSRCRVNSV